MAGNLFEYDALLKNEDATVDIIYPGASEGGLVIPPQTFRFILSDDVDVGASANYGRGALQALSEGATAGVDTLGNMANRAADAVAGKSVAQRKIASLSNSIVEWSGSVKPIFSFNVTLLRTKSTDAPLSVITSDIASMCFPDEEGNHIGVTAPGLYKPSTDNNRASGVWSLRVGKWLFARNLILINASFNYSNMVTYTDGTPIAVKGQISLTPYRDISRPEFKEYFTTAQSTAEASTTESGKADYGSNSNNQQDFTLL